MAHKGQVFKVNGHSAFLFLLTGQWRTFLSIGAYGLWQRFRRSRAVFFLVGVLILVIFFI